MLKVSTQDITVKDFESIVLVSLYLFRVSRSNFILTTLAIMKKLDGKVAVVTGASKGIGAAIAKHLAVEGAAVVVNYAASKEGADRVF